MEDVKLFLNISLVITNKYAVKWEQMNLGKVKLYKSIYMVS